MVFVERLGDPDDELRRHAARGLVGIGSDAIPLLMSRLVDPRPLVRAGVRTALIEIGPAAVPPLINLYHTATEAERGAAEEVLAGIATPAAVFTAYQAAWERAVSVTD